MNSIPSAQVSLFTGFKAYSADIYLGAIISRQQVILFDVYEENLVSHRYAVWDKSE